MTNSDQLMLAAVKAQVPFRINGREVAVEEDKTTVSLHSEAIALLSFKERTVSLVGKTMVSRKSARVFNTILREFTDFEMVSREGQWILQSPMGEPMPIGKKGIILPMKRE